MRKGEPYYARYSYDFPLVALTLSQPQQSMLVLATFRACGGIWFHDERGYHARAFSNAPTALLPLLLLKGSRISRRGTKGYVWVVDRKVAVQWLDEAVRSVFMPRPAETGVCRHCGADAQSPHDPECHLAPAS